MIVTFDNMKIDKKILLLLGILSILILIMPFALAQTTTKAYTCEFGEWELKGEFGPDEFCSHDTSGEDLCWCFDEEDNFYIDESGGVHCRPSSYSSVNNGVWCGPYSKHATKDCVAGTTEKLYWFDSLGERKELIETCSSNEKCTLEGCVYESSEDNGNLNIILISGLVLIILVLIITLLKKKKN